MQLKWGAKRRDAVPPQGREELFLRVFVFSPSVNHDPMWTPVRDLIENENLDYLNPNHRNEEFFFDEPDFAAMERIIDQQFAIIKLSRDKKRRRTKYPPSN